MSSIIRRRSGLTVSVLLMESSILSEVNDASILREGLSTDYAVISTSLASRHTAGFSTCAPRCGLERSDFVHRPFCDIRVEQHKACFEPISRRNSPRHALRERYQAPDSFLVFVSAAKRDNAIHLGIMAPCTMAGLTTSF
jgi:hypothetical protein